MQGQVTDAEVIGTEIIDLFDASRGSKDEQRVATVVFRESLTAVLDGISAIMAGDNQSGIKRLADLTKRQAVDDSLRWVAWQWTAQAAHGAGDIRRARKAAGVALELSGELDDRARSTTLCTLGQVTALSGRVEEGIAHLETAQDLYKDLDDRRGMASVLLTQAKVLSSAGQSADSVFAANLAMALDLAWAKPPLFLAQQALTDEDLDRADELVAELEARDPRPAEAVRMRILLTMARSDEIPLWLIREYLHLRGAPPNAETVGKLQAFMAYRPQFLHLQEELAWKQLRLGRYDEASKLFNELAPKTTDPDMQSSVLLGLGCLATVTQRHRQPAARVRAAVSAFPAFMRGDRKTTRQVAPVQLAPERAERVGDDQEKMSKLDDMDGNKAVFAGALQTLSVPDVVDFLGTSRRTGTLIISATYGIGAIHLRKGQISGAASPGCDNIGQVLLRRGDLDDAQLELATESQKGSPERLLGAIIVEQRLVDLPTMRKALEDQVFSAMGELFLWDEGQFSFTPDLDGQEMPSEIEVQLDTQYVLLEVARRVDEAQAEASEQR